MSGAMAMANRMLSGSPGALIGHENRERVREFILTHLGATNIEIGEALGLSVYSVGRHVRELRKEWFADDSKAEPHP